jgi:hypothetical protein
MLWDVNQMSCVMEQETILLHPEDAISIKLWMDRLKEDDINVFYKDKLTPTPPASRLRGHFYFVCADLFSNQGVLAP